MKLYLVQHGDAVAKEVNPLRPLSEGGRADVERMASFLGEARIRVSRVLHSGKLRAEQTAKLLAASLGPGAFVEKVSRIDPLDPPDRFATTVNAWTEDTMVVGHLPFMARLVSHLVVGNAAALTAGNRQLPVTFRPGTVVCLEQEEEGTWSMSWMIRPELLAWIFA